MSSLSNGAHWFRAHKSAAHLCFAGLVLLSIPRVKYKSLLPIRFAKSSRKTKKQRFISRFKRFSFICNCFDIMPAVSKSMEIVLQSLEVVSELFEIV